ncbi:hypothetical protein VB780_03405 [Leptolyngbya sp. CCNP1308]|uniref:terminase small subunit-like protein n=1 Tax=Leptolyngbya sp. CCNP1308 TaxID=3110255 RepID=UPI002B1F7105|nr:hypothetical protein [Leptolyngbya sp. CCNP1308]MEA5447601.1 hypothetical protein [Leptolyngbya sp. CCNP1308]
MSQPKPRARIKYSEAVVNLIVGVLERGGTNLDAANAAGMDRNTFYLWSKKHPEFKARIEAAKAGYVQSQTTAVLDTLEECRSLAEAYVLKVFKGEIQRVKTRTDATGVVIFKDTETVLPSDRMVERFLQLNSGEQQFNLTIGLAEPDDDYDDDEFSEPED